MDNCASNSEPYGLPEEVVDAAVLPIHTLTAETCGGKYLGKRRIKNTAAHQNDGETLEFHSPGEISIKGIVGAATIEARAKARRAAQETQYVPGHGWNSIALLMGTPGAPLLKRSILSLGAYLLGSHKRVEENFDGLCNYCLPSGPTGQFELIA